jgi:DNA-binding CsgD family transcriptional regulator
MAEQHLITAEFFGAPVSIVDHEGQQWLTAEQVGRCLGYQESTAGRAVRKIYDKHADEFLESQRGDQTGPTFDTTVIDLMTAGGNQQTRIFSATGCQKHGFFARTPKAKDFRTWVAKVLAGRAPVALPAPSAPPRLEAQMETLTGHMGELAAGMSTVLTQMDVTQKYIALLEINQSGKVRITPALREQAKLMASEGLNNADIGRLLRLSRTSVSLIVRGLYVETQVQEVAPETLGDRLNTWIAREQGRALEKIGGAA